MDKMRKLKKCILSVTAAALLLTGIPIPDGTGLVHAAQARFSADMDAETAEWIEEAGEALQEIAEERDIMALVYLADELDPMHMPDSLFSYFERRKGIFVSRSNTSLTIPKPGDPLAVQVRGDRDVQILGLVQQHFDSRGNPVLFTVDYLDSELFNFSVTRIREK